MTDANKDYMTDSEDSTSTFDEEELKKIAEGIKEVVPKEESRVTLQYDYQQDQFRCTTSREEVMERFVNNSETQAELIGFGGEENFSLVSPNDNIPEKPVSMVEGLVPPEEVPEIMP